MRKYFVLCAACFIGVGLLSTVYLHSIGRSTKAHQSVLEEFAQLRETEAALERDTLRARDFITSSYDPLVSDERRLQDSCASLNGPQLGLRSIDDPAMHAALQAYCSWEQEVVTQVELFKTKNAVMRNSLNYIQKQVTEGSDKNLTHANIMRHELVRASVTYYLMPSNDGKMALQKAVNSFEKTRKSDLLVLHVKAILRHTDAVDEVVKQIVPEHPRPEIKNLYDAYLANEQNSESAAGLYRQLLFVFCLVLLGLTIYSVVKLLYAARALTVANATLEMRVEKRTEELNKSLALIQSQQEAIVASAKTSALGEMAGQAAHEINTPLGAIVLTVESLKRRLGDETIDKPVFGRQLDLILNITTKMSRIINSMRKMAGHGATDPIKSVKIKELVDDTTLLCEGRFRKNGIGFTVEYNGTEDMALECRTHEISQILINLLNNAHDSVLADQNMSRKWAKVSVRAAETRLLIQVVDGGPGVTAENQAKLFRANFTTKSLDHGTGFGLSISRKLAEKHQGTLYFDVAAKNTTFALELPWIQVSEQIGKVVNG